MSKRSPQAAGFLIALGALAGLTWGFITEQPNWWVLVGTAAGLALAALLWLLDRSR